jgi:hypothetical protein
MTLQFFFRRQSAWAAFFTAVAFFVCSCNFAVASWSYTYTQIEDPTAPGGIQFKELINAPGNPAYSDDPALFNALSETYKINKPGFPNWIVAQGTSSATSQVNSLSSDMKLGVYALGGGGAQAHVQDFFKVTMPTGDAFTDLVFNMRLSGSLTVPGNYWASNTDLSINYDRGVASIGATVNTWDHEAGAFAGRSGAIEAIGYPSNTFTTYGDPEVFGSMLPGTTTVGVPGFPSYYDSKLTLTNYLLEFDFENVSTAGQDLYITLYADTRPLSSPSTYWAPPTTRSDFSGTLEFDPILPIGLPGPEDTVLPLPTGTIFNLGGNSPYYQVTDWDEEGGYSTEIVIPEPSSMILLVIGLVAIIVIRRR